MSKGLFFNSVSGDRLYNASDFAEYFKGFFTNGVFYNSSDALKVSASGNQVVIAKGRANINGYCFINESNSFLGTFENTGTNARYDAIAVEVDSETNRKIDLKIIRGTASSSPVKPTPTENQIILAYIYVKGATTEITNADITDTRFDNSVCGIVTQAVNSIDVQKLYEDMQYKLESFYTEKQTQFVSWFDLIKGMLSGDIVTNFTEKLAELEENQGIIYKATGTDDNIKLKTVIDNFLNGANDNRKLEIKVIGDVFDCTEIILKDSVMYNLVFGGISGKNRNVKLDFTNCGLINGIYSIYADSQAEIIGLNYDYRSNNVGITTNGARFEKCNFNLSQGISGTHAIMKDCKIKIKDFAEDSRNALKGINCGGYFENCNVIVIKQSNQTLTGNGNGAFGYYVDSENFPLNIVGGSVIAYSNNSLNEAIGVYIPASKEKTVLNVYGLRVPTITKTGYFQTESIKLNNGFGSVIGSAVYKEIKSYSTVNFLLAGNNIVNMSTGLNIS